MHERILYNIQVICETPLKRLFVLNSLMDITDRTVMI